MIPKVSTDPRLAAVVDVHGVALRGDAGRITAAMPVNVACLPPGAMHRVAKDVTAWNARDATFSMVIAGIDSDPTQAEALKRWGRAYWSAVHPFNLGGAYVNFMMDDEADGRSRRLMATTSRGWRW